MEIQQGRSGKLIISFLLFLFFTSTTCSNVTRRSLLPVPAKTLLASSTRHLVQIKAASGSCLSVYDGNSNSKPYNWACNVLDRRQLWYWYSDLSVLQAAQGSCLAIYSSSNNNAPYNWGCDNNDRRQQWSFPSAQSNLLLRNAQGTCLAIWSGSNDQKPYSWSCAPGDSRQQWSRISVLMVKVQLRTSWGKCVAIYDGSNSARTYQWTCDINDPRQHWYWFPDQGILQSASVSCLAIYDSSNSRNSYGYACDASDVRQKWSLQPSSHGATLIKSGTGSCLAVYDNRNDANVYGYSCTPSDPRQWFSMEVIDEDQRNYVQSLQSALGRRKLLDMGADGMPQDEALEHRRELAQVPYPSGRTLAALQVIIARFDLNTLDRSSSSQQTYASLTRQEAPDGGSGWRIDRQSTARPRSIPDPDNQRARINVDYYTVSVQAGSGFNNVYATVQVPVNHNVGRRIIRHALLRSAQEGREIIIMPVEGRRMPPEGSNPSGAWLAAAIVGLAAVSF